MYLKLFIITGFMWYSSGLDAQSDTDPSRYILGDWKVRDKMSVRDQAIEGFQLLLHADTFNTSGWNSEGVMYMNKTFLGSREYPSSFDYKISGDSLFMRITFSAAGYKVGDVFNFGYTLSGNSLILSQKGVNYRFKRNGLF
jgi:hypothetical protein